MSISLAQVLKSRLAGLRIVIAPGIIGNGITMTMPIRTTAGPDTIAAAYLVDIGIMGFSIPASFVKRPPQLAASS